MDMSSLDAESKKGFMIKKMAAMQRELARRKSGEATGGGGGGGGGGGDTAMATAPLVAAAPSIGMLPPMGKECQWSFDVLRFHRVAL
jgi:hypothetical protein